MAENTIDNLSIQVVASAEKAISTFNRLASGASGLRGAARGAAGGMQDMAQGARDAGTATQEAGTQAGKARPNIKGVGKDAKDAGDNAKKGSSGIATFWQSLKRIAYYRMIRSIIKAIGQAFREGAQNLYQWSSANPGLSDFAKNMNRIATSVTYLKNSLGAMLEPIVRILTPIIEWVIDKLVWLIDKVNQFFAALSGAETYTAAKKVATTWGDAADGVASSTHKAAEDIRRTLLGFDEINRLDKPNSGSYSGGGGTPSMSAAAQDMFEERPLEGWAKTISDFIRKIKDFFDGIFGPIRQLFTDAGNAFDDLNRSIDAARQEDKTVNINVKINTTAEKLWNDFVDEWDAIKNKTLFLTIRPATLAETLFKMISDAWDGVYGKTLFVNIMLSQKASYLWETLENAWNNLQGKTLFSNVQLSQKAAYLWETLQSAWDGIQNKVLYADVMLSQKANYLWTTLSNAWDGIQNKVLYANVSLSQKATYLWDTLKNAWNGIQGKVVYANVSLSQSANYLWTTLKNAWNGIQGKVVYLTVEFTQKANYLWTTLKNAWDGIQNKVFYVEVELKKNGWKTVSTFVDDSFGGATGGGGKTSGGGAGRNKSYSVNTELEFDDSAWQAEWDEFVGKPFDINVGLQKSWLGTPKEYLGFSDLTDKTQQVKVALKKVAAWQTNGIGKYLEITTKTPKVNVDLKKKWGNQDPVDYLKLSGLSTSIKVGLKSDGSKLKMRVSKGTATIESAKRRTENVEHPTALGGVFSNGRWSRIPQYANGTTNAHGSLFLAGEAGPEIVGHVGGRTEVLNKSQLASAMFSAVQAAMAPAAANFASAAQSMGVADAGVDMETLAEMVRQGVEQAMGRQNELDRQRNEYLRQINEKDYNPEISTSSINKAQRRMNRRAGTTIVPVGT